MRRPALFVTPNLAMIRAGTQSRILDDTHDTAETDARRHRT